MYAKYHADESRRCSQEATIGFLTLRVSPSNVIKQKQWLVLENGGTGHVVNNNSSSMSLVSPGDGVIEDRKVPRPETVGNGARVGKLRRRRSGDGFEQRVIRIGCRATTA